MILLIPKLSSTPNKKLDQVSSFGLIFYEIYRQKAHRTEHIGHQISWYELLCRLKACSLMSIIIFIIFQQLLLNCQILFLFFSHAFCHSGAPLSHAVSSLLYQLLSRIRSLMCSPFPIYCFFSSLPTLSRFFLISITSPSPPHHCYCLLRSVKLPPPHHHFLLLLYLSASIPLFFGPDNINPYRVSIIYYWNHTTSPIAKQSQHKILNLDPKYLRLDSRMIVLTYRDLRFLVILKI